MCCRFAQWLLETFCIAYSEMKLSQQEMQQVAAQLANSMDTDGDQKVSFIEFREFFKTSFPQLSEQLQSTTRSSVGAK